MCSCTGPAGQLRNNCRGLIRVVYEESRNPYMAQEDARVEASHIADYRRVLLECPETCTKEFFYDCFVKSFMPYGEVWQGVENCHPGASKTCYEVKVVDIGDTFTKGKLERPFLIHAAALDAAWQGCLGSTCYNANNGDFGFDKPMVPTSIGELEISVDVAANVGYMMPGICRSHRHGFNEFSANINMFDKDLSRVFLSVADFRLSVLEMADVENSGVEGSDHVDPADIASEVHWNYALDVMEPTEINQVVLSADATTTDARLIQVSLVTL